MHTVVPYTAVDSMCSINSCDPTETRHSSITGDGTRGALGALAPTKFTNAHRNLVFAIEMCLVS